MGRTLYAYANKLWKVKSQFNYTGEAQQFTIDPGEYLFICNGAAGGGTSAASHWGYGATAYGVFETDQTETMYAVVGGNGKSYTQGTNTQPTPGGFNGGGAGGYNTNSSYQSGGSGGGGTDIRLTLDETLVPPVYPHNLPNEYLELEDIHLQWEERAHINTGYYTTPNTRIETTMRFHSRSLERRTAWQIPFGTRLNDNGADEIWMAVRNNSNLQSCGKMCGETIYEENIVFPCDEKVNIVYDTLHKYTSWTSESGITKTINFTRTISQATSTNPLFIFTLNHRGNPGDYHPMGMRMYDFKIYEQDPNGELPDTLMHHYIPAQRKSDNMYGVYDLIDQTFIEYTPYSSGHRMFGTPYPSNSRTLLSRILVAGGGGGDAIYDTRGLSPLMSYGGGRTAGWTGLRQNSGSYSHTDCLPASQDEGYAFGKGADGWMKETAPSYGAQGAGGGGGGWFGGYTEDHYNANHSSIGGSGGSSYALTADSWKPQGYIPTSHYYLHDTALVSCQSENGSILICVPVKTMYAGDTIITPFTGNITKLSMFPGTYRLKCYGGEGGISFENGTSITRYHGGYSEGELTTHDVIDLYPSVGGAGLFYRGHTASTKFSILNEIASFNGGGTTVTMPMSYYHVPWSGGGGTDIRLNLDETPAHTPEPDPDTRDDIPEGYTQLKSLYTNGANPFESGVVITSNTEVIYDFKIDPGVSGSYPTLLGTDSGPNYHSFVIFAWNGGSGSLVMDGGNIDMAHFPKDHRLVFETTLTDTRMIVTINDKDEGMVYTYSNTRDCLYGTDSGLTFNCLNRNGYQNQINNTTYGIKFKENGVLTHDFVPVKRNSDNALGFYDVITDEFRQYYYPTQPTSTTLKTVTYPSKTLLSRFIVAGGAGGMGYNSSQPGKGGGTTGGTNTNGNGTNSGPGTQASSPQSESYSAINGGFGYGGKGIVANNGRGGAGGGGWFGGSGTYPDGSSDNDKGGSGGSGYVLTENSYKPAYYIPDESFYLENASTTLGGNTLGPNISRVEIEVISAYCNKIIIHDSQGYKMYDSESNRWEVFSTDPITPEDIETYGVYIVNNLTGVKDRFDILTNDPEDVFTECAVNGFELSQNITWLIPKRYKIARTIVDATYDDTIYTFSQIVSKYDDSYNAYTLKIDKTEDVESLLKLYSVQLFSK